MNLSELQNLNLDFHNISAWPLPVKIGAIVLVSVVVLVAGYMVDTKPQLAVLEQSYAKEQELKSIFEQKQAKAANLNVYREQMIEIENSFGTLLRQLPSKTEVAELLSEVSTAGVVNGLEFLLFQPEKELPLEFYAELPIKLQVVGGYHEFGRFVSDVAILPRIVTLHDFTIRQDTTGELLMEAQAKTYRYLDDDEIADLNKQKKTSAPKRR